MYPSGEIITPLPRPCSILGLCGIGIPNCPNGLNCCMSPELSLSLELSPSLSPLCRRASVFEATVTFTIAGVTRAATFSIARSRASNGSMLLSSRAAAAGAGAAAAASAEFAGLTTLYALSDTAISAASEGTIIFLLNLFFKLFVQPFIVLPP